MKSSKFSAILVFVSALIFSSLGSNKESSSVAAFIFQGYPAENNISASRPISTVSSDADMAEDSPASNLMSASPVKQVIRGVISFGGNDYEVCQDFSPSIDPAKSIVLLSKCVENRTADPGRFYTLNRNGACLISLSENSITVAVDYSDLTPNIYPQRVSYQIIEYK